MTMALPRPSTCGARPAYLDNMFRDLPPCPSPTLHSANSSIWTNSSTSSSTSDYFRPSFSQHRPLTPTLEQDDGGSIRSLRLNLSPRFRVRNMFSRRSQPQVEETTADAFVKPAPTQSRSQSQSQVPSSLRRPSLPRLHTSLSLMTMSRSPPKAGTSLKDKPLPVAPTQIAQELPCHRCYYFAARHCNGWVMGGKHGDACEQCLQAGFFGQP